MLRLGGALAAFVFIARPWTRNQKLILAGLVVTATLGIGGLFAKVHIEIKHVRRDLVEQSAEIRTLKSELAVIDQINASNINASGLISSKGGFESITSNKNGGMAWTAWNDSENPLWIGFFTTNVRWGHTNVWVNPWPYQLGSSWKVESTNNGVVRWTNGL